jgi:hypothetical protein
VLSGVKAAVPPGSTDVSVTTMPTIWIGSCSDEDFKRGWSEIGVTIQFTSNDSNASLRAHVSRWMSEHGWKATMPTEDPTEPRWTRRLSEDVSATALLSYGAGRYPPDINATAPPEAPVGECAGG